MAGFAGRDLGAGVITLVTVAACSATASPAPIATPTSSPTTTATSAPTASSSPTLVLPGGIALRCGAFGGPALDLGTCLRVLGATGGSLPADRPAVDAITVFESPSDPSTSSSSTVMVGSASITIRAFLPPAYSVEFAYPGGAMTYPVYEGADGELGLGLPPSQVRLYDMRGDLTSWVEATPFALEDFTFSISGSCFGTGTVAAGGTVILERVTVDGATSEVHRATCGPVMLGSAFGEDVPLKGGTYRVRVEDVTVKLDLEIWPVATFR